MKVLNHLGESIGYVERSKSLEVSKFVSDNLIVSNKIISDPKDNIQKCIIVLVSTLTDRTNAVSHSEHIDNLVLRAPKMEYLMEQLQLTQEYICSKRDNTWNKDYLDDSLWKMVRDGLVDAIAECSFHANNNAPSSSLISVRSKLYCSKRLILMKKVLDYPIPPVEIVSIAKFQIEWKSTMCSLFFAFVSIFHRTLCCGSMDTIISDALEKVKNGDKRDFIPSNSKPLAQCLYYVAGYLLSAAEKESNRRGNTDFARDMDVFVNTCVCADVEEARFANLPISKVERLCAYGGLKYASCDFF